jgi:2-oxoglutarate/2-oxoacid ferredoxin oxidoreductase subunit alpha
LNPDLKNIGMTTQTIKDKRVMTDGSELIIESLVQAGADAYVNYPITPANWLNTFASKRFPFFMPAPDEITTVQWLAGLAATGKIPATATSFPGYALMIESINLAFMMEVPMVIVLVQRLGPSTGSATVGAEGDLMVLNGTVSGGYQFPVLAISSFTDCWTIPSLAVKTAVNLRTPVVVLTSKEMIMTSRSFDLSSLEMIQPFRQQIYSGDQNYLPYEYGENLVPDFLPVANEKFQVRLNASTHDKQGLIRKATQEAIGNTVRLRDKMEKSLAEYTVFSLDEDHNAETILVSYGISSDSCRDALQQLRRKGTKVSLLILNTLIPIPPEILEIMNRYKHVIVVEENISGLLVRFLYGYNVPEKIRKVNAIAKMITPTEIVKEVELCK